MSKRVSIKESLEKLENITKWFEGGEDLDVEEGLKKAKDGVVIIKELKKRLKDVENEFEEIKRDLEDE